MGYFNSQILTHKGLELLASAAAGSKVIFETIKAGSGTYTVKEISKLQDATDLKDCKQTFNISAIEQESEQIRLKAVISNQGLSDGYDIRELGVFAKKENGDSIMVAISIYTDDKPTYLPKYENTPVEMLLSNVLGYSGNGNFAIQYSSDVYVPIDIFKKKVEQLTNEKVDLSAEGVSEAINQLSTETAHPSDADYYISGGATTTSYHRRPVSALWSYIKSKADSVYSAIGHKHTKSEITDFPTSMSASDVYPWAKASAKPSYTKSEVGLGNVDNTADSEKSVKYATSAGSANNSTTVNGHTVNSDVPANAKFTDTVYTHPTTSGNKHIPSGGSSGQILKWSADGTATWENEESEPLATTTSNGLMSSTQFKNLKDLISTSVSAMGTSMPGSYGRILKLSSPINGSGNDAYGIGIDTAGRLYTYFGNNGSTTAAWKTLLLKSEMSLSNIYITSLSLGSMTLKGNYDGDAPQVVAVPAVHGTITSQPLCIIPRSSGSADVCWIDCYIDSNNRTKVRLKNTVSNDKTFTPSVYVIYKTLLS